MKPRAPFSRRSSAPHTNDVRSLWEVNKYLWMTLGFLFLYLVVAQLQGELRVPFWSAGLLFALAVLDGASRSYLAYRRGGFLPDALAWCYTLCDMLLISFAIRFTGGLNSDLWLVYFVVMIFESLYSTRLQKLLIDVAVLLAYLLATLPQEFLQHPAPAPPVAFLRILIARYFFLVLVGSLGRRISLNGRKQDQELALLRAQMATTEERGRIAREIHDGLGHALVSSILRLELCARLIPRKPEEATELLKEEIPALRAAWNESRDLAFQLQPWEYEGADLPTVLRRHIARFAERTGLPVDLKVQEESWNIRPEMAFALTRIVQEALTNTAKHAHATHVEISLETTPDNRCRCTIQDDGEGFDPDATFGGVGLQGMRERVSKLGGDFQVVSEQGKGVRIVIIAPN